MSPSWWRARLADAGTALEDAAADLYAPPWKVFAVVTVPLLSPALVSGWLLAFTLSLDDVVVASFTSGPGATTLPMLVFSATKLGVTPEIYAALATVIVVLVTAGLVLAGRARRIVARWFPLLAMLVMPPAPRPGDMAPSGGRTAIGSPRVAGDAPAHGTIVPGLVTTTRNTAALPRRWRVTTSWIIPKRIDRPAAVGARVPIPTAALRQIGTTTSSINNSHASEAAMGQSRSAKNSSPQHATDQLRLWAAQKFRNDVLADRGNEHERATPATTPGNDSGSVSRRNARNGEAPRSAAASSKLASSFANRA